MLNRKNKNNATLEQAVADNVTDLIKKLEKTDIYKLTGLQFPNIINKDYWIISSSINYSGSISQSLTLREVPD